MGTIEDVLRARIEAEGPISFAEFMEVALYDERAGYYARPPVGPEGDFVTSPHVSPAFGALLARQLAECWELLERPDPFRVVEAGAGDGTLARQILAEARHVRPLARALRYTAVERSAGARRALAGSGIDVLTSLTDAGEAHVVLANELLDNLPFHRLRGDAEIRVGVGPAGFVEVEAEAPAELRALAAGAGAGEERVVSPAAQAFVREVAGMLRHGYAFLLDYAAAPGASTVHGYEGHRVLADVLAAPGSRDITAGVDFETLAGEARSLGLRVWGPVPQREALLALGLERWIEGARRRSADARERGDHREEARLLEARSRASILVDGSKLGALQVLVLAGPGLPAPAAAAEGLSAP